jgi:hypothetical protein
MSRDFESSYAFTWVPSQSAWAGFLIGQSRNLGLPFTGIEASPNAGAGIRQGILSNRIQLGEIPQADRFVVTAASHDAVHADCDRIDSLPVTFEWWPNRHRSSLTVRSQTRNVSSSLAVAKVRGSVGPNATEVTGSP